MGYPPQNNSGPLIKTQTDKIPNVEHTTPYVMSIATQSIAAVGPTNMTAISITPTFPTGATKVRAYVVASLHISNQSANAQDVTPSLQAQVNAGGYNNVWVPGAIVASVPATQSTSAMIIAEADITAYVVSGQQTDIRFVITQTSANAVRYLAQATIFLVYHM